MTRSRKILWIAAGVVVAGVSVTSFGGLPSASDLVSGASSKDSQAKALEAQASQAQAAAADAAAFADSLASARRAVPPTPMLSGLITMLDEAALASGVTWTSGSPTRATNGDVPTWGMEVVVTGTLEQITDFITRIRSLPRLVVVSSVSIQEVGDASSPQATIGLEFFAAKGELLSFPEPERAAIEREWQEDDDAASAEAGAAATGAAP